MTKQSPRIYTYKITFEEAPYYYYGVHKEKRFNEYYMGSPKTHKWAWDFYTPKKQILEFFEYSDEGWTKAVEIESQLIKLFYNTDKWCLNAYCGGKFSIAHARKNGIYVRENKLGIFSCSPEQRREFSRMGGQKTKENKTGFCGLTLEQRVEAGKIGGKKGGNSNKENKTGFCGRSPEKMSEDGKKSGKVAGNYTKENGLGIFGLTKEQLKEARKKGGITTSKILNTQKWQCTVTGYVSTSGPLTRYQKSKGIDPQNRIKIG